MNCRICGDIPRLVLDLGYHPPSDAFLKDLKKPETTYPLELYYCDNCGLAQIGYVVDPSELFQKDYPYATGVTKTGVKHFEDFAESVINEFYLLDNDLIVDIGGNDGTLLHKFFEHGCKVLNIDPSGVESSVPLWKAFWCMGTAHAVRNKFGRAKIILATNVFAHVDDLNDFVDAVKVLLADDGVFIIESPCFEDMLNYTQFDQIYHEHLSYLSEKSVGFLMKKHNLDLYRVEHNDMHGGSNRYFIRKFY